MVRMTNALSIRMLPVGASVLWTPAEASKDVVEGARDHFDPCWSGLAIMPSLEQSQCVLAHVSRCPQ